MNFTFLKILVKKEFAQIAKDRSALVIAFLMPLILVVIYGYAMRMDIKPVKVGFVSDLGSKIERDLLGGFLGSKYLQTRVYTDLESARRDFRAHEIESILYFDPRFAAKFQNTLSGLGGASGGINLNISSDESSSAGGANGIQNMSSAENVRPLEDGGAGTESGINASAGSASGESLHRNGAETGGNVNSFGGGSGVDSSGSLIDVSANQGNVNLIGGVGDTNAGFIDGASDIQNTSGGVNTSRSANGAGSAGNAANNGGGSNNGGGASGAGGGSNGTGSASNSDKDGAEIFLIQNATQSQLALLSYVYVAGVIEQVLAQD